MGPKMEPESQSALRDGVNYRERARERERERERVRRWTGCFTGLLLVARLVAFWLFGRGLEGGEGGGG